MSLPGGPPYPPQALAQLYWSSSHALGYPPGSKALPTGTQRKGCEKDASAVGARWQLLAPQLDWSSALLIGTLFAYILPGPLGHSCFSYFLELDLVPTCLSCISFLPLLPLPHCLLTPSMCTSPLPLLPGDAPALACHSCRYTLVLQSPDMHPVFWACPFCVEQRSANIPYKKPENNTLGFVDYAVSAFSCVLVRERFPEKHNQEKIYRYAIEEIYYGNWLMGLWQVKSSMSAICKLENQKHW